MANKKAAGSIACGPLTFSFVSDYKTVAQATTPACQRQFAHVFRIMQPAIERLVSQYSTFLSTISFTERASPVLVCISKELKKANNFKRPSHHTYGGACCGNRENLYEVNFPRGYPRRTAEKPDVA